MKATVRAFLICSAVLVTIAACHDSPTEPMTPTPTPTATPAPTATPTPVLPGPAGLFGSVCGAGGHGPCEYGLVPGVTITIVQGSVVLQAVSAADGSYTFPVGGGLVGPNHCVISTNAPTGFVPAVPFDFHLTPGLNGPLLLQVIGPDRGP